MNITLHVKRNFVDVIKVTDLETDYLDELLKARTFSWLWSERGVMMKEGQRG